MIAVLRANGVVDLVGFDSETDPGDRLVFYQTLVGGYIEVIDLHVLPVSWVLVIDEEGKIKEKPINQLATRLAHSVLGVGDFIAGDAILLERRYLD